MFQWMFIVSLYWELHEKLFSLQRDEFWQHFIFLTSYPYRLFHVWPFGQTLISGLVLLSFKFYWELNDSSTEIIVVEQDCCFFVHKYL